VIGSRRWRRIGTLALGVLAGFLAVSVALVALLRWVPPLTSAVILQHRLQILLDGADPGRLEHGWVPGRAISPHLALAVVAAEDQRFPVHSGFDLRAIREALEEASRRKRMRGASTLSQQVAKNLFLWSGRSWLRKGLEAYFTVLIEIFWPKRRILDVYLNIAQFGPEVYGAGAASARYFGVPSSELKPDQAALLAAVLPNPRRLGLQPPSPRVLSRAAHISRQMRQLGASYLDGL
jgi:monofunctional biosynthetic peptidoglycan transglycosylase